MTPGLAAGETTESWTEKLAPGIIAAMRNPIAAVSHFLAWVMDGVESGPVPRRLAFFALALGVLLMIFAIVVEVRCLLGWIGEGECHAWD